MEELIVKLKDLRPVGFRCSWRIRMHGVDGSLELESAWSTAAKALPNQQLAFADEVATPESAVLIRKQHEASPRRRAGRPPRLDQQHEREKADRLRLIGH